MPMPNEPAPPFGTFFLPGPTEVRAEVLQAMTLPMIPHRGAAFEALFARLQVGLKRVFVTERPVFVSSSSATGLMEASVRCAPPGRLLAIVNGAFSERFANIARDCGRDVEVLEVEAGDVANADDVRNTLTRARYAAVAVVHSETSTGALTDVRAVSDAAREAGAVCLVDSVTGVAAAPLPVDEWQLDFALTGSQKALALPPGLALGVASAAYMTTAGRAKARGLYFDLVEFEQFARKNQTPNTPAISLLYALEAQLERTVGVDGDARLAPEPITARWARHAAMAAMTHAWVEARADRFGIGVLAGPGTRSPTVTAITVRRGLEPAAVVRAVAARGFVIGGGYGKVKDRTFRIGHMGDHTPDGLARCLEACDDALAELTGAR